MDRSRTVHLLPSIRARPNREVQSQRLGEGLEKCELEGVQDHYEVVCNMPAAGLPGNDGAAKPVGY